MQIRIEASQCQVLVVDIQTRLAPVLLNIETMLRNVNIVLSTATALDIPVTIAQQIQKVLVHLQILYSRLLIIICLRKRHFPALVRPH
jgi:hypothetical protein